MNLTEWARTQGIAPRTAGSVRAFCWSLWNGWGQRTILVDIDASTSCAVTGGVGLYARVSRAIRRRIWSVRFDMVDVLTSLCARRYGRRSARNRAEEALEAAAADD